MAVGFIKTCEDCGKSYDDSKGHYFCDGGKALATEQKALNEFNQKSVDERLEFIYQRVIALEKSVGNIPYNGPIS